MTREEKEVAWERINDQRRDDKVTEEQAHYNECRECPQTPEGKLTMAQLIFSVECSSDEKAFAEDIRETLRIGKAATARALERWPK